MRYLLPSALSLGFCLFIAGCGAEAPPPAKAKVAAPAAQETPAEAPARPGNLADAAANFANLPAYPTEGPAPAAPEPTPAPAAKVAPTTPATAADFIPEGTVAALIVRPKQILESKLVSETITGVEAQAEVEQQAAEVKQQLGIDPRSIEELRILISGDVLDGPPAEESVDDSIGKLRELGLAFLNYHETHQAFPRADGPAGEEAKSGLSWRVHLLPFLGEQLVYDQFNLDEPWDSENNKPLIEQIPDAYKLPGDQEGTSRIHVFTGEGTPLGGTVGMSLTKFTDGTSNTLLAVVGGPETGEVWTKPGGLPFDATDPLKALGTIPEDGVAALASDGSVHRLTAAMSAQQWASAIQYADGGELNLFEVAVNPSAQPAFLQGILGGMPTAMMPLVTARFSEDVRDSFLGEGRNEFKAKKEGEVEYLESHGVAVYFPEARVVVLGPEKTVTGLISRDAATSGAKQMQDLLAKAPAASDVVLAIDASAQGEKLGMLGELNPMLAPLATLRNAVIAVSISGKAGDSLASLRVNTAEAQDAESLQAMLSGLLEQIKSDPMLGSIPLAQAALESVTIAADKTELAIDSKLPEGIEQLSQILIPGIQQAREAARQTVFRNNMKQIGLAFHTFADVYQSFPHAAGPVLETDEAKRGLSWRVHLLPFLDRPDLYAKFKLDEPWDSEHNRALIEEMPDVFKSPGIAEPGHTAIHVFVGEGTPFGGEEAPKFSDFTDGMSHTILAVRAASETAVPWTKPGGLEFDAEDPWKALGEIPEQGILVLIADGSVRTIDKSTSTEELAGLIRHQDGKPTAADAEKPDAEAPSSEEPEEKSDSEKPEPEEPESESETPEEKSVPE